MTGWRGGKYDTMMVVPVERDIIECLASGWGWTEIKRELRLSREMASLHLAQVRKFLGAKKLEHLRRKAFLLLGETGNVDEYVAKKGVLQ